MSIQCENWKRTKDAARAYKCGEIELERWAHKGLIYGHHIRGAHGGWLIQTDPKQFEPSTIRIREERQAG